MGKRKSRKKPVKPRMVLKVPTQFDCPFCNHSQSVECKMQKQRHIGEVRCSVCDASFQCEVTALDEAVDVYSAWIDECERQNRRHSGGGRDGDNSLHSSDDDDEDDDERDNDSLSDLDSDTEILRDHGLSATSNGADRTSKSIGGRQSAARDAPSSDDDRGVLSSGSDDDARHYSSDEEFD
jgi:transcription elongation factor 1